MRLVLVAALAAIAAAPAQAAVRFVPPFDPGDYADRAAVGFVVVRHGLGQSGGGPQFLVSRPANGKFERDERYPVALLGERGLLTSDSTRVDGLVAATDLASGDVRVVSERRSG